MGVLRGSPTSSRPTTNSTWGSRWLPLAIGSTPPRSVRAPASCRKDPVNKNKTCPAIISLSDNSLVKIPRVQAPGRLQPVHQPVCPFSGRQGTAPVMARGQGLHRPGEEDGLESEAMGGIDAGRHESGPLALGVCGARCQQLKDSKNPSQLQC